MMKKVFHLFQIVFSKSEKGIWYDSDRKIFDEKGWGLVFKIWIGKVIRPVPKYWIKNSNPWRGDDPWFVIRIPWIIAPFISVCVWNYGFYFGFKVFDVNDRCREDNRYGKWMRQEEFGTDENPAEYLTPSASIRQTRWK